MFNDNFKTKAYELILNSLSQIIGGVIFSGFCLWIFIKGADIITKCVIIPFLLCGISILFNGLIVLFKGLNILKEQKRIEEGIFSNKDKFENTDKMLNKLESFTKKLYLMGFFIFWFGFLIVFDYVAIKAWTNDGKFLFYFSIIFWIAGIVVLVKNIKK